MDGALLVSVADAPVLASGVATKLRNAAIANGDLVIPTSKGPLAGRQFRQLGQLAALTEVEAMALVGWIEEAYSEEAAQRFLEPLPHVCITASMPSPAAPVSSAMAMGATSAVGGGLVPSSSSAFASLLAGGSAPPATSTAAHVPLATAAVAGPHQLEDEDAHRMDAGRIATLTFLLHTARLPPPGHESVKYGVDPSSMGKLYRDMQRSVGSLLWELVARPNSTMKEFQDHFHRAVQAASGDGLIQQRLSSHWMELSQYFDSVDTVRAYYKKFLTIRSGRGLPKMVDEHIVMLVMCGEFERLRSGSDAPACSPDLSAAAEKASRAAEVCKETVADLKVKVGELKSDLNNVKTELKNLKEKVASIKPQKVCTYCGAPGHTELGGLLQQEEGGRGTRGPELKLSWGSAPLAGSMSIGVW